MVLAFSCMLRFCNKSQHCWHIEKFVRKIHIYVTICCGLPPCNCVAQSGRFCIVTGNMPISKWYTPDRPGIWIVRYYRISLFERNSKDNKGNLCVYSRLRKPISNDLKKTSYKLHKGLVFFVTKAPFLSVGARNRFGAFVKKDIPLIFIFQIALWYHAWHPVQKRFSGLDFFSVIFARMDFRRIKNGPWRRSNLNGFGWLWYRWRFAIIQTR